MAKLNLGRVGIVPQGNFDNTKTYSKMDMVYYPTTGSSYVSLADNNTALPTDSTKWQSAADVSNEVAAANAAAARANTAAEAAEAVSDEVADLKSQLNYNKTVTPGYIMTATNVGTGQIWSPVGTPTDEQTATAVSEWLDNHPESTTTVDFKIVTKIFDTVSHLQSDSTLKNNDNVRTNGYYSVNDGGGAYYKISTTASRACSVSLANGLYANLIGDSFNTRQIGLKNGDNGQEIINSYISDTTFRCLTILDEIHVQKENTGTAIDNIELIKIRRDNFIISFEQGGKIILDTLHEDYYRILAVREAENIEVRNPCLVGDAETIGITTGEYGHGLYIIDSKNISVYNGNIGKCFGDAVVVTGFTTENVTFIGTLFMYDCGRQGMTVNNANGLYIDTIVGKNINRTSPGAVIDLESNSENNTVIVDINTVKAIDCTRGFLATGRGEKQANIGNVICEHTDASYTSDFQVGGATPWDQNPNINVHCFNLVVYNSAKNSIIIDHPNENVAVTIDNTTIIGANKTTANAPAESTVLFVTEANSTIRNIVFKDINVKNNVSNVPSFGVAIYSNTICTFSNCYINYHDDSTQVVSCVLRGATLTNTILKSDKQSNNVYMLNSETERYIVTSPTNFRVEGKVKNLLVELLTQTAFVLYKFNISDYTITSAEFITEESTYWTISNVRICSIVFNHVNKTITVTKIA